MTRHILVPFDDSPPSTLALEYALREYPEEQLTVVHVLNLRQYHLYDEGYAYTPELLEQVEARGEELLERARQTSREHGVEIETALVEGVPARAINDYVDEHGVDHVVMGSHGRSGATRILLGSIAETVVRRSPVPVTVIR
ncbi:universal stress protein [Natronorubrum sp. DTA7]|uniref:universal stress protein n=1 Tax=Natronorubrum sp. DTA7 TaxID=3447016 RepID=UPI003F87FA46